ncbi:hypothetical protein FOA52_010371 [Chlamydomonas sp. UWO 241]|nr:hypothetical protein FOA52_010371 [Chlamydomonas sp. UWO 241]
MAARAALASALEHVLVYEEATKALEETSRLCVAESRSLVEEASRLAAAIASVAELKGRTQSLSAAAGGLARAHAEGRTGQHS